MANYDIVGNVAIVKFKRGVKGAEKKKFAKSFLATHNNVTTILEKSDKFKGRLRTQSTKWLMGVNTKEALYKENDCTFRLNVDTCYFSPRLSSERLTIAKMVKKKEHVLVLFGGVAPFAIVIAKHVHSAQVVSVELGRECTKYAHENVRRNKLEGRVEVIGGDVKKIVPTMKETFDRIVMARPNLQESFLGVTFPRIKKGGIIHYYGFYHEDEVNEMNEMILEFAKKAKRKVKITGVSKAGDIGTRKYRYRADIKVLN